MAPTAPTGPRNTPGPGAPSPDEVRKLRFRNDLVTGIILFVLGIGGTIVSMSTVSEQPIVTQAAALYEQFGLGDYHRPNGLAAISWLGIVLHVINYAVWLFIAVKRWQAGKFAVWCAFVGAVVALVISVVTVSVALLAHPELVEYLSAGALPTPSQS